MRATAHKRNLILDSTIFDLQIDGGISRYWFELIANMARRHDEWNLTLFADPHTRNKFGQKLIEVTKDKRNVGVHSYAASQIGRLVGPWLSKDYRDFLWHSSYYRVPTRPRVSSVCTVYDFIYERTASRTHARLHAWIKRKAILGATQIICISGATKRDLCARYPEIPDNRCHVIHLGPSAAFHAAKGGIARTDRQAPVPYVLFVGARAGYKNFSLAVRATEAVLGHELVVVGGGKLSKSELDLLRERLPNRYRIFDTPTDEILCDLYRGATALAYLSRFEGFGFPPLEAMASGCPVIGMNASSIPEVVGDAGILLSSEDPMAVADAIRAVAVQDRRVGLIDKGLKRAAMFSWDRTADETVGIYERAIACDK
jgi:mannosyltransferase